MRVSLSPFVFRVTALVALCFTTGCSNVYYRALEKVGIKKRELLADRVEDTQESQQEAKEQFASALEQLLTLTRDTGGDLKVSYDKLADELDESEDRAKEVNDHIAGVRRVAQALFGEWEQELDQYTSQTLRSRSEPALRSTRKRYDRLVLLMQRAADRMDPVFSTLRDQVLCLKHNLNAQTVAGLDTTARELQTDIGTLIADMERSIAEADAFLADWTGVKD